MTFYPDMGTKTMIVKGRGVRAVGWLHPEHSYTQGSVSEQFLTRLQSFAKRAVESERVLGWPSFCGCHLCEFCDGASGSHNFGVPARDELYVAPQLVAHYVERHGYHPPDAFIEAVMASPLPGTPEYWDVMDVLFPHLRKERRTPEALAFYQCLGPEIGPGICGKVDCQRKTVECSVLCRRHHFEMVKRMPCPFSVEDYKETRTPEELNLIRWRRSSEPLAWVRLHQGQWQERDWQSFLTALEKSEVWPMEPQAVRDLLEKLSLELRRQNGMISS